MRLTIPERVNPNCYVFQMGFVYPVCIWNKYDFLRARDQLTSTHLGNYANEHQYWSVGRLKQFYQDRGECRWYAGQRKWRERRDPRYDFWLVFRTEADRTMAMMLLS